MTSDIDKNLKELQTLVKYHKNSAETSSVCQISNRIVLVVGHIDASIKQFTSSVFGTDTPNRKNNCQYLSTALEFFNTTTANSTELVVFKLPTPSTGGLNLREDALKIDFLVKQTLAQATEMKVILFTKYGSQHFHQMIVQVKSLLEIVPNNQTSVGLVLAVDDGDKDINESWSYGNVTLIRRNPQTLISELWTKESLRIAGVKTFRVGDRGSSDNLTNFVTNQLKFATPNGVSFEVTYLHQVLDTVKGYFNAFNSGISDFAETVFQQIIPNYYQQPKKFREELAGMNETYYKLYKAIDNFDFLDSKTYLPSNLVANLKNHSAVVTPAITEQIGISSQNYLAHADVVKFFAVFRPQNKSDVTASFEEFERGISGDDQLVAASARLKEKHELKMSLMELDEMISFRTDAPSKSIHENMDGALTVIEQEIDDRIVDVETHLTGSKKVEWHNLFENVRHWLQISKLHRTIGTESDRPTKVFQQALQTKLAELENEVEQLVKVQVALTVRRSLKNVVEQKMDIYDKAEVNLTEVLSRLDDVKPIMRSLGPWNQEAFSVTNFSLLLSNTTVDLTSEHEGQFLVNRDIYFSIVNITENFATKFDKLSEDDENVTWIYEKPKPVVITDPFAIHFKTQSGTFARLMNDHIDEFKEDVGKRTVAEVKANNRAVVDAQVKELDQRALATFRDQFDPEYLVQTHDQPRKRLQKLHDASTDYSSFLKSMTLYFEIHAINITAEIKTQLDAVEEEFKKVDRALQGIAPTNTFERWGDKFEHAINFLQNSASSQPSVINSAVRWIVDKSQKALQWSATLGFETKSNQLVPTDMSASLMLADVLVRSMTNSKMRKSNVCLGNPTMDVLSAQGHALNVLDKCEAMFEGRDVDVLSVQKQLMNRIMGLNDEKDVAFVEYDALKYFNVV